MPKQKKIAILGGGCTEQEISRRSAKSVQKALEELGYHTKIFDPFDSRDNKIKLHKFTKELKAYKPHFAFNVLHGGWGENGGAQEILEELDIPTNSTHSSSAKILGNKLLSTFVAKKLLIKCAETNIYGGKQKDLDFIKKDTSIPFFSKAQYTSQTIFPHIIKHTSIGSSFQTAKIHNEQEAQVYFDTIWSDSLPRLICDFIHGQEYSIAIVNGQLIGGIAINYDADFCDYETKYSSNTTLTHDPLESRWDKAKKQAEQAAMKLYTHLDCKGLIRFDFILQDENNEQNAFFLECNVNPGMLEYSIVPDIFRLQNFTYTAHIKHILKECQ